MSIKYSRARRRETLESSSRIGQCSSTKSKKPRIFATPCASDSNDAQLFPNISSGGVLGINLQCICAMGNCSVIIFQTKLGITTITSNTFLRYTVSPVLDSVALHFHFPCYLTFKCCLICHTSNTTHTLGKVECSHTPWRGNWESNQPGISATA